MRWLWVLCGGLSLGAGLVGTILPLVPTVPFLLLSAFCFARSSERLHLWLLTHPRFGPPIGDWNRRGAIGRGAKRLATVSILAAFGLPLILRLDPMILAIQGVTLLAVAVFVWTRPD